MKKCIISAIVLFALAFSENTSGQVRVNVNVNIGAQPEWGPAGYDHVEYYYMPDIDAYYYVPNRQFIYLNAGRWVFAASLPDRYHSFDLYRGYKVVVNDPYPYRHCDVYRERYGRYKGWNGNQAVIRDRPSREEYRDRDYDREDHPGNRGRGHAYGHYKHHNRDDD